MVPFGFRSSLASFIRVLQLVLRSDSTGYVLTYVDIIVYSNTYEETRQTPGYRAWENDNSRFHH